MKIQFRADSSEDAAFRAEFRAWLARELPAEWRGWATRPPKDAVMAWHKKLYAGGYVAPHWPTKFGGMGAYHQPADHPPRGVARVRECAGNPVKA